MKLGPNLARERVVRPTEPSWLQEFRAEAWRRFEELPFPTRTDEEWRRTDPAGLDLAREDRAGIPLPDLKSLGEYAGIAAEDASRATTAGEGVSTIVDSGVTDIGRAIDRSEKKFSSLNDAFFGRGVAAIVKKNLERPVSLLSVFRGQGTIFPRALVVVEPGCSAVVLDERLGDGEGLAIGHLEIRVKEGGSLVLVRLQNYPAAVDFETVRVVLEKDARAELATLDLGGPLTKLTIDVDLACPGAHFAQNGLIRMSGARHIDVGANIRHRAPGTSSDLLIKSAVKDKARSVFTGLIVVEKKAVKTNAFQTNRNLLLSRGARADSIPKLEILADDVKCGHGSATGSVDPEQLFYLQSRGIPPDEGERLIVEGFFEEALGRIGLPGPMEWIRDNLRQRVIGDGRL
jgi:Fe-S cluster assembly protein SufD